MADSRQRPTAPSRPRVVIETREFRRWSEGLSSELGAKVRSVIDHIVDVGPTLGRPHVDAIHGSRVHKLKEGRIDRGTRVLFAFDSNRNALMLVGGDKTGKWNRWYPDNIRLAERLYLDHERSIGKEARWLTQRAARNAQMSR